MNEDIVAIVGGVTVVLVAILGSIFIATLKILKGGGKNARRGVDPEEAKLMQEIHQGLQKMEDRVESLETLLIEEARARKERAKMDRFSELED
ncbi:MAG: hypothetical protein KC931_18080 [Candidatus Omnitrophica bacterium]|nr:hypothetical protein [Candidatus Omnitrophota bacterium]MCA9417523.1 hypothetical protein [Candidatus Omnitrophota bacterium]MCA9437375.1 hypothetical protein [Candidatus Omnitrophota bacterium]MCA9449032.1 hypothetical protein [Candidatus Omnitrophota bacterium]MCB9768874.1 hypothetical protein [Candidatus Omnitrophota bacterium]